MTIRLSYRLVFLFPFLAAAGSLSAQPILVGNTFPLYGSDTNPTEVTTFVQMRVPATGDGLVTTAVFGWSASPCPAAVKLKFFHVEGAGGLPGYIASVFAERGPFDVTVIARPSGLGPPAVQTVALNPPVQVRTSDIIGITNLTSCGGPTYSGVPPGLGVPSPAPSSARFPGDVGGVFLPLSEPPDPPVLVWAAGTGSSLVLLGRFSVTLSAVDPRTGRSTVGTPIALGTAAGYFSLPDFTGDPTFPEVMVKMVDATGAPALGGGFWFFHAPLTDVAYTITVTDTRNGAVRTYHSTSGNPGQLCGEGDTSAFPP
jgi:hypothetical protein